METKRNLPVSLSREYREELMQWKNSIMDMEFDYVAVMPRRCLNLFEALSNQKKGEKNKEGDCTEAKILTDQGLLLKSREIAEAYLTEGKLRKIAVVDELIVHGRAFGGFLTRFYATLLWQLDRLAEERNCEKVERKQFWDVFHKSIGVYVFYENAEPMILREEYQWRLSYWHIGPSSEWRKFSLGVTKEILEQGVANSSYIISASHSPCLELDSEKLAPGWIEISGEESATTFDGKLYLDRSADTEKRICPCVRVYTLRDDPDKTFVIPYFFAGSIGMAQGEAILDRLGQEKLSDHQQLALQHVRQLAEECLKTTGEVAVDAHESVDIGPYFAISYFQIIALLLAQITLDRFLKDSGLPRNGQGIWESLEFDTKKIAKNFGNTVQGPAGEWSVEEAFSALIGISWDPAIWKDLYEILGGSPEHRQVGELNRPEGTIHDGLCKELYDIAVNHEQEAQRLALRFTMNNNIEVDSLDETVYARYEDLLTNVLKPGEESNAVPEPQNVGLFLLYLTEKMDQGDAALKVLAESKGGTMHGTAIIQTTENALSIVPRLMGKNFMDLFRLVQYFSGGNIIEKVDEYFRGSSEQKKLLPWAKLMAEKLQKYPYLANALFDWAVILGK